MVEATGVRTHVDTGGAHPGHVWRVREPKPAGVWSEIVAPLLGRMRRGVLRVAWGSVLVFVSLVSYFSLGVGVAGSILGGIAVVAIGAAGWAAFGPALKGRTPDRWSGNLSPARRVQAWWWSEKRAALRSKIPFQFLK
jgi:hypothetical protein